MNPHHSPLDRDISGWPFLKGHGTGNDFVLLPDLTGERDPSPAEVARICDRHFGIGADGVLRIVPTALVPEVGDQAGEATYFMDYRNADGSLAEMCGNGIRVFARYLVFAGLATPGTMQIATRGGVREVIVDLDGHISVDLGDWRATGAATVTANGVSYAGTGIALANPHVVVEVNDLAAVGSLTVEPSVEPAEAFADGVNVEFLVRLGPRHLAMRVHERGSGETLSCGTGAAAVAAYVASTQASTERADYQVDVPGGILHVVIDGTRVWLRGPAVLVAQGRISDALRATGGG